MSDSLHIPAQEACATAEMHRELPSLILAALVVLAGVAIVLNFMLPGQTIGPLPQSKSQKTQAFCSGIATQIKLYLLDVGLSSPANGMDLSVLVLHSDAGGGKGGPYLNNADDLIDPWGTPYVVRVPGLVNYEFDVVSYGADRAPGGEGEDADITN